MIKKITLAAGTAALALTGATTAPAIAAPTVQEPLPVGTCINIGNTFEPETENGWGGKRADAGDFARIKAAGFETIRLPVRWYNKSDANPPHAIDPAWMARIVQVVDEALAAELKVILNSHHFEPIYADPAGNRDWLAAVWTQVAAEFADRPLDRLWFEIENEPHDKFTNENLVETLTPALAAIRASNPDRAVIVGGGDWSSIDSLATLEMPEDHNIHSTFHYYAPFDFTHQGASWTGDAMPPVGRTYGTANDARILEQDVAKLKAYIARTGKTPFMGETGAYDANVSLPQRIQYHTAVQNAFGPTGVGICAWAYTNTFPFYDHEAGEWLPGLLGAMGLPDDTVSAPVANVPVNLNTPGLPSALQPIDDALPGALMNDPRSLEWETYGDKFKMRGYSDPDIPGGQAALQFKVSEAREVYAVGANVPLLGDISRGDTVTIGFFARTVEAATADSKGRIGVRFQRNQDPYPGFGDTTISPDGTWGWYEVSAVATQDIPKRQAIVALQFGAAEQTVEVGQTIVVKGTTSIVD